MASRFCQLVIDSREPLALARFWADALGRRILYESGHEVIVGSGEHGNEFCVLSPYRSLVG